jgi:hypothetical protein
MIKHASQIYKNLKIVSEKVKESLRTRGLVIPTENADGSITLGSYLVCKSNGFYQIKTHSGNIVEDHINLPQTAIIVANGLALGKFTNCNILFLDQQYGYAVFEEELHNTHAERNHNLDNDRAELLLIRSRINHQQKLKYRDAINRSFEKLLQIDK